ncbi:MAG: ATP phosphoribosyltransferase regulatory subunit [Thermoanaerobaculia bacterium]|nr:ATP phosphoribosyltransferase regulatory subunit [Thermoanaerobaculia bacterium]
MRVSAELPLGVASLFGAAARERRRLETDLVTLLEARGFEEVILPILDYVDPYEAILGPGARSELYRFTGREGETLALRSDFTPMLARLLAPRVPVLELPARFFYRGDVVRYREPRVGARREMYQLGTEIVAPPGESSEREALEAFVELLDRVPGPRPRIVLGLAGALDELLGRAEDPARLLEAIGRRERAAARNLSSALLEVVEGGVPSDPSALGSTMAAQLGDLQTTLAELSGRYTGIDWELDLAEFAATGSRFVDDSAGARSYYDGVVFRAYLGREATPVGGGGRYDRLFERLGANVSAVGFSLGLDGLLAASQGGDR